MELCTTMCSSASGHSKTPVSGSLNRLGAAAARLVLCWRRRLRRSRRDIGDRGAEPLPLSVLATLSRPDAAGDASCKVRWRSIQMAAAAASSSASPRWWGATGASCNTMIGGSRLTDGEADAESWSGSETVVVVVRVMAVVVVVDVCPVSVDRSESGWLTLLSPAPISPFPCFDLNSPASQHFYSFCSDTSNVKLYIFHII